MKVSVITVCLNSQKSIHRTLESVKSQDYNNIEHIIIDGGSSDQTLQIVQQYEHVSKLFSGKDKGVYFAMNKGLSMASGDIFCFLNADDFYEADGVISSVVDFLKINNADIIYADLQYVSETQKVIRYWKSSDFSKKMLRNGWMPAHPTVFFKRDIFDKFGGFDINFRISADYDWILRIFKQNFRVFYLPKILVNMTVGGISNRSLKNILLKSSEDLRAIRKNKIGNFYTLICKNIRKISQFYKRKN